MARTANEPPAELLTPDFRERQGLGPQIFLPLQVPVRICQNAQGQLRTEVLREVTVWEDGAT
jgi:hypothetical protein